jgi:hypothetical protein
MDSLSIESFEQLQRFLREWRSYRDRDVYDLNGMAALMAACLENLQANVLESDLDEIGACFSESQKAFIKTIAQRL